MTDEEFINIRIRRADEARIDDLKEHPNVPDSEIVERLIDFWQRYKGVVDSPK